MISSTQSPKNKTQLISLMNKLPTNSKFEVIEVFSMKEKTNLNKLFDQYMRKGHFSVMFIDGGN